MDSTEPERSLSGISLPQWMKSKIADRYDLDQSTFSPPSEDDSFFFIRYPKAKSVEPPPIRSTMAPTEQMNYCSINDVLQNHTVPCRQFMPQAKTTPHELGLRNANDPPLGRIKSAGTDDGFKGEGAACGHSVVAVAHQMINGKLTVGHKSLSDDENTLKVPDNRNSATRQRRNSKSLPASPTTLRRNPYFTSILLGSSDALEKGGETSRSGWLLNILGKRESQEELLTGEENLRFSDQEEPLDSPPLKPKVAQTLKAKPSELREMNFWSPTSM